MYYSLNPNCGFERNRIPPIDSRRRRSSYKRGSHLLHINVGNPASGGNNSICGGNGIHTLSIYGNSSFLLDVSRV